MTDRIWEVGLVGKSPNRKYRRICECEEKLRCKEKSPLPHPDPKAAPEKADEEGGGGGARECKRLDDDDTT
jgi:hypothetical protein